MSENDYKEVIKNYKEWDREKRGQSKVTYEWFYFWKRRAGTKELLLLLSLLLGSLFLVGFFMDILVKTFPGMAPAFELLWNITHCPFSAC